MDSHKILILVSLGDQALAVYIMRIIRKITESKIWDDNKESIFFIIVFVLFPSFLPVWITIFAMFLTGNWTNIGDLVSNGAFFIYSAALLSAAIEKMDGSYKKDAINLVRFLHHCSWFLIVLSTVGFMVAITPDVFFPLEAHESRAITITSFVFVGLSLAILYYAHHNLQRKLNPEQENRGQVQNLMDHLS